MARKIKPGGTIAFMAWSSQNLLPGYPELEARLNATSAGIAPFNGLSNPGLHFNRALEWMDKAGLNDTGVKTFVGEFRAPLSDRMREAVFSLIDMRWENAESEVSQQDWEKFGRLCNPDAGEFILDLPGCYGFFTYTLFHGKVGV